MKLTRYLVVLGIASIVGLAPAIAQNSLSVTLGAALGGTSNGLDVFVDGGQTNAVYVESDHPNAETHMIAIWRMNLKDLVTANVAGGGRNFRFMTWQQGDGVDPTHLVMFAQRQTTTGNWRLAVWSFNTTTNLFQYVGGTFLATFAANVDVHIKCEWTRATTGGGTNGQVQCYRATGTNAFAGAQITNTALTNGIATIGSVRMGFLDFDGFPTAGQPDSHAYFDEYESYR